MLTVCMRARCPGVHLRVVIIVLSESGQLVAGVSIKTLGADPRAGLGWAGLGWLVVVQCQGCILEYPGPSHQWSRRHIPRIPAYRI